MADCPQCGYPAPCGRCDYAETQWDRIFAVAGARCAAFITPERQCGFRVNGRGLFCPKHQDEFARRNKRAL